jgi:hypothetical protein
MGTAGRTKASACRITDSHVLEARRFMKLKIVLFWAVAFGMASACLALNDEELIAGEYRWIVLDGPYACPSKDDLRQITNHHTDELELHMVEQLRAYYLVSGTIVHVVDQDSALGMSQIHLPGITSDLWTLTRFLSERPMRDPYGVIETPETAGLIPVHRP